jgi:predicted enzyme related to lactoylglutathione lyase
MYRRDVLCAGMMAIPGATIVNSVYAAEQSHDAGKGNALRIQYLEIVTNNVDAACALYSTMYGASFGKAVQRLGGARTAKLAGGGMLGVRAPLRPTEMPVVRPYVLVKDIKASVAAAAKSGADIAMEPTEIPGHGQFAIVVQGGIESGLWQL